MSLKSCRLKKWIAIFERTDVYCIIGDFRLPVEGIKGFFVDSSRDTSALFFITKNTGIRGIGDIVVKEASLKFFNWHSQMFRGAFLGSFHRLVVWRKVALK